MSLNNWNTSYSTISFVERALGGHSAIKSFERINDIQFNIERESLSNVVAVVIGRYTISLADVIGVMSDFPEATCIVAEGNWCRYTREAKEYGISQNVGVFIMSEFLGALNKKIPNIPAPPDEDGNPSYLGYLRTA